MVVKAKRKTTSGSRRTTGKTAPKKATARKRTTTRRPRTSTRRVSDVMTSDPVALVETESLTGAARAMREHEIGDVIVLDGTTGRVKGIVTDRDMTVRAIAEGRDPNQTTLASIVSEELVATSPADPVDKVVRLMRDRAIRRVPVVEDGQAVGILSIGDLAQELDERSALAEISAAPPNA